MEEQRKKNLVDLLRINGSLRPLQRFRARYRFRFRPRTMADVYRRAIGK